MRVKNTYAKAGGKMLLWAFGGALFGIAAFWFISYAGESLESGAAALLSAVRGMILPILVVILLLSAAVEEYYCKKLRGIHSRMEKAEDEEFEKLDFEEEKAASALMIANVMSQCLCILVLATGYSGIYLESEEASRGSFLLACFVFLLCFVYDYFVQIRYVKMLQKLYPERKLDPASKKFEAQWFEGCDEAEKEIVYRSAYSAYLTISKCTPILLVITMLGHLLFNTGLMAIIVVAVSWMIASLSYRRSCVTLKEKKALVK